MVNHVCILTYVYYEFITKIFLESLKKILFCLQQLFVSCPMSAYSVQCYTGYITVKCKVRTLFIYLACTQFTDHFIFPDREV